MKRITADTGKETLTFLICGACLEEFPEEWRKLSESEAPAASDCDVCEGDFEAEWRKFSEIDEKILDSVEAEIDGSGPVGKPETEIDRLVRLRHQSDCQLNREEIKVLKRSTAPTDAEKDGLVPESFDTEALRAEPVLRPVKAPTDPATEALKVAFGKMAEKAERMFADLVPHEHDHLCQKCCFFYRSKDFTSDEHVCPKCGYRQICTLKNVEARLREFPKLTTTDLDHAEMESRRNPGGAPIVWIVGLSVFWLVVFGIVWLVFQ